MTIAQKFPKIPTENGRRKKNRKTVGHGKTRTKIEATYRASQSTQKKDVCPV